MSLHYIVQASGDIVGTRLVTPVFPQHLGCVIQSLEQEVAQEEGTSQALREEAQRRDSALQQLRTAVKEVSSISQTSWFCLYKPDFFVCPPHLYSNRDLSV